MTYSHTPPEYKDLWPPMPWIVRKVVVPYVLAVRYSGSVLSTYFQEAHTYDIYFKVLEILAVCDVIIPVHLCSYLKCLPAVYLLLLLILL
jgi:hypothetical protein